MASSVLVDTSVWARHLRHGDAEMERLLLAGQVLIHPFVRIEILSRRLAHREEIAGLLATLPVATHVEDGEVTALLERRRLAGSGLGLVDLYLLASALLSDARLWTADRRLAEVARRLGIGYGPVTAGR